MLRPRAAGIGRGSYAGRKSTPPERPCAPFVENIAGIITRWAAPLAYAIDPIPLPPPIPRLPSFPRKRESRAIRRMLFLAALNSLDPRYRGNPNPRRHSIAPPETKRYLPPLRHRVPRTIAKSPLLPVILSGAKNPVFSAEAPRSPQRDNLSHFAIVLHRVPSTLAKYNRTNVPLTHESQHRRRYPEQDDCKVISPLDVYSF